MKNKPRDLGILLSVIGGIVGAIIMAISGIFHFWYLDNAFVCVSQGKIDSLFTFGAVFGSLSGGYLIGRSYVRKR